MHTLKLGEDFVMYQSGGKEKGGAGSGREKARKRKSIGSSGQKETGFVLKVIIK